MTFTPPKTRDEWRKALASLPAVPPAGKIPSFYFGHGQPMLIWPESLATPNDPRFAVAGPQGALANFLKDFGPALLEKYQPKAIVVFSAHWETRHELVGSLMTYIRCIS